MTKYALLAIDADVVYAEDGCILIDDFDDDDDELPEPDDFWNDLGIDHI